MNLNASLTCSQCPPPVNNYLMRKGGEEEEEEDEEVEVAIYFSTRSREDIMQHVEWCSMMNCD